VQQPTVAAAGETTVVRRASSRNRVLPIAISAGVLVLVACGALGFYALHKPDAPVAQIAAESPSPLGGPAATSPSPTPAATSSAAVSAQAEAPATEPKRNTRNEEPKKSATPAPKESPNVEVDVPEHEQDPRANPPDVPVPPDFDPKNRQRRPPVRVMPGGVTIRNCYFA
jgi:hypothetical protein